MKEEELKIRKEEEKKEKLKKEKEKEEKKVKSSFQGGSGWLEYKKSKLGEEEIKGKSGIIFSLYLGLNQILVCY